MNTIQERIRQVMDSSGLSLRGFARETGISPSGLSGIFSGKTREVSPMYLMVLELRFQVNPEWLRNGRGKMFEARYLVDDASEAEMLRKIRMLDPEGRKTVLTMVEALYRNASIDKVAEKNRKKNRHWP